MLRLAWTEWLCGRGVAIGRPAASRAQPGGWNCLTPVPVPNGFSGLDPRQTARRIGRHPRPLVAADAEGLQPVARRTVGDVAARVGDMERDVVRRVDVGRLDHAAVAVDAVVAAVAREAIALVAPRLRVVAAEGRAVRVEPAQRPGRLEQPHPARRDRRRRGQLDLQPTVRLGQVAGAAAGGRLIAPLPAGLLACFLAVVAAEAAGHHRQIEAGDHPLGGGVAVAELAADAARGVQAVVELQIWAREHHAGGWERAFTGIQPTPLPAPSTWQASQRAAPSPFATTLAGCVRSIL